MRAPEAERPTGPNQTEAILYETKDLLRDLIQKAGQIEQLLWIIHYNLPPVGQTHHAPLQQAQPLIVLYKPKINRDSNTH